jgi:hypothetical protein
LKGPRYAVDKALLMSADNLRAFLDAQGVGDDRAYELDFHTGWVAGRRPTTFRDLGNIDTLVAGVSVAR